MIAAARISAAIDILDRALDGTPLEVALSAWGRSNRYAGSTDRAAIRDLVFDAWRCRRSYAALGGGETGRGLMLGRLRAMALDVTEVFTGIGHAPGVLTDADRPHDATPFAAVDCPDWLGPRLQQSLGALFEPVMQALQHRARVFLRVNLARISRADAAAMLRDEGIETAEHLLAASSLQVLTASRKLMISGPYMAGLIDLQDVSSQAIVEDIPLQSGQSVLDYCAGGGGKALALAARADLQIWAHDAKPGRMADLPTRAQRAGAAITLLANPRQHAPYDLVMVDAPCSGSGSWRRDPQGKWALTEARLAELVVIQADILQEAAALVAPGGLLAYATCSLLAEENQDQINRFLHKCPGWQQIHTRLLTPLDGGDGFYLAILRRVP